MQLFIVAIIVAVAVALAARRLWRQFSGKSQGCDCGCGKCEGCDCHCGCEECEQRKKGGR